MELRTNFDTRTYDVHHDDGHVEQFKSRAAALIVYPEVAQPVQPMTRQQEKALDKAQRDSRAAVNGYGHSSSGRRVKEQW